MNASGINEEEKNDGNCDGYSRGTNICRSGRYTYEMGRVLGHGSFGVVTEAKCIENNIRVAIKKVIQDPRYKNRELDIMIMAKHPNIVKLIDYFYVKEKSESIINKYLCAVLEFMPETAYKICRSYSNAGQQLPMILVKIYTYQLFCAIAYLHRLGICHRDIKPQNLLIDPETHILKLCDFGSAKALISGQCSVAYICSRYYRAPELMLGSTDYSVAVDTWSTGCVIGELILGKPMFPGETSLDQLVRIIRVLGAPDRSQMEAMNSKCTKIPIPDVHTRDLSKLFPMNTSQDATDLISKLLLYEPLKRLKPIDALKHRFFDELRIPTTTLPSGAPLPPLQFIKEF